MHLKNFSLISEARGCYHLTPTYDQVSTALVLPEDKEEMALTLQGFKVGLQGYDFLYAMQDSGLDEHTARRLMSSFSRYASRWEACIDASFVTDEQKVRYKALLGERLQRLAL